MIDYMDAPRNGEVLKDGVAVNAAEECRRLAEQIDLEHDLTESAQRLANEMTGKYGGMYQFLNVLAGECHKRSDDAGWWMTATRDYDGIAESGDNMELFATKIALIHSEVSEMLEGLRKGLRDDHLPHRSMEEVEAADIIIRLFDYAGARKMDLAGAVYEKMEYNAGRSDHTLEARSAEGGKAI